MEKKLTPKYIVEELNKHIISQDEAKKSVAISLRNRMRRKMVEDVELKKEITPKNIILIGNTGVGKTEIARRLAKIANAPFIKVEATKYTEIGYVGNDVESIIKDLANIAFKNLKEQKRAELETELSETVYEKLAKIYKPYDSINDEEKMIIIQEIKSGRLDSEEIELNAEDLSEKSKTPKIVEVFHGDTENNPEEIQNMISSVLGSLDMGGKKERAPQKMSIKKAFNYLLNNEVEEALDIRELESEVIEVVQEEGIVFIDEIDKIVERDGSSKGEVSRQGVQRDILPIVEGCTVSTKFGPIKTDHILFIAAGAFSQSSPKDIMPELQGRFPVTVKLNSLKREDFMKILTEVENNLLKQYEKLMIQDNVALKFSKTAIEEIADLTETMNEKIEDIGARRLHTILETVLRDIMYEAPYEESKKITIDRKYVRKIFKNELEDEDLDRFIL